MPETTAIRKLMGARRTFLAPLAALLLAGCGGEAPTGEAAARKQTAQKPVDGDICAWLDFGEIESLIGARPAASAPSAGLPGCMWTGANGLPVLQATLAPNAAASAEDYAARYAAELGEAWSEEELKPVTGLGDFAFYTADARMLQVFRGRRALQIMVSSPAGEAEAIVVARAMLARDW